MQNISISEYQNQNHHVITKPILLPIADTGRFIIAIVINDYIGISSTTFNIFSNRNYKYSILRVSLAPGEAKQISTFCPLKFLR